MSKKPLTTTKSKVKSLLYALSTVTPKRPRIKTTWDLKSLYYQSDKDPSIERDIAQTEAAYTAFAKRYRNSDFTSSPDTLLRALQALNEISANPATARPGRYFGLRTALNSNDDRAQKQLNLISARLTKASNQILFFELELGKIPKKQQHIFLTDKKLAAFSYYLSQVFENARHNLTEAEERILRLDAQPAKYMWADAVEKIISNRTICYKKQSFGLYEAIEHIQSIPPVQRPQLWELCMHELGQIAEVAEHELTALVTRKKTTDELRGFNTPYAATVLGYQDDMASVEALIKSVSTKGFALSREFYKHKAEIHGIKQLHYASKYDPIGPDYSIPFDQAVDICRDVFYQVNPEYGTIFDKMLAGGQIDVYPSKLKRGGAFMSGEVAQPTQVFLNHTNNLSSLETLAHEMGHAIHAERSKVQPPHYEGFSTTTAETASTLFENLVFDALYEQAPDTEKANLLHHRITRDIATVQRQISFFNFEYDMHTHVRAEGAITKQELNALMQKHLRSYLGSAVSVTELDGHSYVYISHFRYGFYVYTYTFGHLMSSLMAEKYKVDDRYRDEIDRFLTAGESASVHDIFKTVGFDTRNTNTFDHSLERIAANIKTFKKLTR